MSQTQGRPPGPKPLEMIPRIRSIQKDALGFLTEVAHKYGPIAHFAAGALPVFVLSDRAGVRHVLQDRRERYSKDTIQYNSLAKVTGEGLLTSDGDHWRRQRRLIQPAFSHARLMSLGDIIVPATRNMLDRWQVAADTGDVIDIDDEMMRLTLEVVGKALFSIDLSRDAQRLTRAVLTALDHIVHRARHVLAPPEFIPTPRNLRFKKALRHLDETVAEMVERRRSAHNPGEDLLGMMMQARDDDSGESMSDAQIRDEILTMIIAGHETVASALTWTWWLLARHPQARRQLKTEVDQALQGRPPRQEDLDSLSYTEQVFSEALRLYPPAWVISRSAVEADEILGFAIPKGALIILSPYVIHRDPSYWEKPEAFQPERFAGEPDPERRYAYIPFGAGPRLCIGARFAMIEAKLILAMVVQRFSLDLPGDVDPQMDALVTLRPRHGLPMHLRAT